MTQFDGGGFFLICNMCSAVAAADVLLMQRTGLVNGHTDSLGLAKGPIKVRLLVYQSNSIGVYLPIFHRF